MKERGNGYCKTVDGILDVQHVLIFYGTYE